MRNSRPIRVIVSLVLLLVASQGYAGDTSKLKVSTQGAKKGDFDHVAVGVVVQNLSSALVQIAHVECAALDKGGTILDTGQANIDNLQPDETAYKLVGFEHLTTGDVDFRCRISSTLP